MSNIKLIFSDLDGTLLNASKNVLPETKKELTKAIESGVNFSICTARAIDEGLCILKYLSFDKLENVFICGFNGGVVYDVHNRKILDQKTIEHDEAVVIFEEIKKFSESKAKGKMGSQVRPLSTDDIYHEEDRTIADFSTPQPFYWWNKDFTYEVTGPKGENMYANNWPKKQDREFNSLKDIYHVAKITVYFEKPEIDRPALWNELKKLGYNVELSSSHKNNGEITPVNITKGYAVENLCRLLKVSLNDTMTMGDNFNDYSMLELCPNSITLSTAPFEVRQVAKVVIDKPASEFVGEAIKMFINNKNKK